MSLADLRKELRDVRKSEVKPVSRMKKHEVVLELEKRKGGSKKEEPKAEPKEAPAPAVKKAAKKVAEVMEKAEAPAKVAKKAVAKVEEKKAEAPKKKSKSRPE